MLLMGPWKTQSTGTVESLCSTLHLLLCSDTSWLVWLGNVLSFTVQLLLTFPWKVFAGKTKLRWDSHQGLYLPMLTYWIYHTGFFSPINNLSCEGVFQSCIIWGINVSSWLTLFIITGRPQNLHVWQMFFMLTEQIPVCSANSCFCCKWHLYLRHVWEQI